MIKNILFIGVIAYIMMQPVSFRLGSFSKKLKHNKKTYADFIIHLCHLHHRNIQHICIILVSDKELWKLNMDYLSHDTYTDILTFFYMEADEDIFSDIFISRERLEENAVTYKTSAEREFLRLCIHGILHLCGNKDKTSEEKRRMRRRENQYIKLFDHKFSGKCFT